MESNAAELPSREVELAADAFKSVFPDGLPPSRPAAGTAIETSFPLSEEHLMSLAANDSPMGVKAEPLKRVSQTHHRLAQLLAAGMDPGRAGIVCNYGPATVSILQTDPMFQELLAYYGSQVEDNWKDVVELMADLHLDVVEELRTRLEQNPSQFSIAAMTDLMKALSDRTGHGPTTNIQAAVVSLTGADLERLKASAQPASRVASGQAGVLTEAGQRLIEGRVVPPADIHPDFAGEGWDTEGTGDGVREEGSSAHDFATEPEPVPLPPVD